jgi:hypothetical protein
MPEQIAFDHQGVEPGDVGFGVNSAQEKNMLDG